MPWGHGRHTRPVLHHYPSPTSTHTTTTNETQLDQSPWLLVKFMNKPSIPHTGMHKVQLHAIITIIEYPPFGSQPGEARTCFEWCLNKSRIEHKRKSFWQIREPDQLCITQTISRGKACSTPTTIGTRCSHTGTTPGRAPSPPSSIYALQQIAPRVILGSTPPGFPDERGSGKWTAVRWLDPARIRKNQSGGEGHAQGGSRHIDSADLISMLVLSSVLPGKVVYQGQGVISHRVTASTSARTPKYTFHEDAIRAELHKDNAQCRTWKTDGLSDMSCFHECLDGNTWGNTQSVVKDIPDIQNAPEAKLHSEREEGRALSEHPPLKQLRS